MIGEDRLLETRIRVDMDGEDVKVNSMYIFDRVNHPYVYSEQRVEKSEVSLMRAIAMAYRTMVLDRGNIIHCELKFKYGKLIEFLEAGRVLEMSISDTCVKVRDPVSVESMMHVYDLVDGVYSKVSYNESKDKYSDEEGMEITETESREVGDSVCIEDFMNITSRVYKRKVFY